MAENLHGLYGKQANKAYNNLSKFVKKVVSENVLLFTAAIGGLYKDVTDQIVGLADKIIAATAFLEQGLVLTNNHKHFPALLFQDMEMFSIGFKVNNKYNQVVDVGLYQPRYELIARRIKEKNKLIISAL